MSTPAPAPQPAVQFSVPAPAHQSVAEGGVEAKPEPKPEPRIEAVAERQPAPLGHPASTPPAPTQHLAVPQNTPETAPIAAPQGPTDFLADNPFAASSGAESEAISNVSRPREGGMKRRMPRPGALPPAPTASAPAPATQVSEAKAENAPSAAPEPAPRREVRARDFAAATVVQAAPENTPNARPQTSFSAEVPVDNRPLDKVDEELIASGILAPPPADSLTSALPASIAVAESPLPTEEISKSYGPDYTLATATFTPPKPDLAEAKAEEPLANPEAGGLPWANAGAPASAWDISGLGAGSAPSAATPPPDIYNPLSLQQPVNTPFSAQPVRASVPPVLDPRRGARGAPLGAKSSGYTGVLMTAAVVAAIGAFAWYQSQQPGGLQVVSQHAKEGLSQLASAPPATPKEQGVALLPPPEGSAGGNAKIDFAAPTPDPNAPIVATGQEKMPEDISFFAKIQKEVAEQRALKEGQQAGGDAGAGIAEDGRLTKEQSEAELATYRQLLNANSNPETAVKPQEFLSDPQAYMDGKGPKDVANVGELMPPPATTAENGANSQAELLPPPELYKNNPDNLPIVAEPTAETPRVRTLSDFAAEVFTPEPPKVQIPQGVRPKLAATDFPTLEVLSFVPGRGVIALSDGREGVLLIGETISGWQLTNVTGELAEFQAGKRKRYLTAENSM